MMTDLETLRYALDRLDPATCGYDEWFAVGAAIKNAGGSVEEWRAWSMRDAARYVQGECERKWASIRGSLHPVGVGTVVELFKRRGGEFPSGTPGLGRSIGFGEAIDFDGDEKPVKVIREDYLERQTLPPARLPYEKFALDDFSRYLDALFDCGEYVGIVADAWQDKAGKFIPTKGFYTLTAGELRAKAERAHDISDVIGDYPQKVGAWVRFNPLDGAGVADANVTSFRFALVECDELDLDKQYTLIRALELPCAAIVASGGKSVHAIVHIDAGDFKEYQKRVDYLYATCAKNGLSLDKKNRNPSRLSRLPGVKRGDKVQYLVETNVGKENFAAWKEYVESIHDDLPELVTLDAFATRPELAPSLIDGVLRQGHKMLFSGASKTGKSFALQELSVAVAEGTSWMGFPCHQGKVIYINLELDERSCVGRYFDIYNALDLKTTHKGNIDIWNLRGRVTPLDKLTPMLIRRALKVKPSLIIIDPIYKVVTGDENNASEMAHFCNQFDKIAVETGAAVVYAHHHSKGGQGSKLAQDRVSGSGVFARDPDALIDMILLDLDDARRAQIANVWGAEKVARELDAKVAAWRNEIGQDDALILERLLDFAAPNLGEKRTDEIRREAEAMAKNCRGCEIGGILREFPDFAPFRVFFNFPLHYRDKWHLLDDAEVSGQQPKFGGRPTTKKQKDASKLAKDAETVLAVSDLSKKGEVSVAALSEEMGISERAARDRLKSAGYKVKNGIIKDRKEK